jgi:hypothetical protein
MYMLIAVNSSASRSFSKDSLNNNIYKYRDVRYSGGVARLYEHGDGAAGADRGSAMAARAGHAE